MLSRSRRHAQSCGYWRRGVLLTILAAAAFTTFLSGKVIGPAKSAKLSAAQGRVLNLALPKSALPKKVELCRGKPQKCVVLASSAKGASVTVKIPSKYPVGDSIVKISARKGPNQLSLLSSRAVYVRRSDPEGGSGGGGNGGGGGGSGSSGGQTEPVLSQSRVFADFVSPEGNARGQEPLDVRVQLSGANAADIKCQQWLLDGRVLTVADWEGGQAPDLSSEPCLIN